MLAQWSGTHGDPESWAGLAEVGLELVSGSRLGLGDGEARLERRRGRKSKWVLWVVNRGAGSLACRLKATRPKLYESERSSWYLLPGEELGIKVAARPFHGPAPANDAFRLLVAALPAADLDAFPPRAYHLWKTLPRPYATAAIPVRSVRIPIRFTPDLSPPSSDASDQEVD